MNRVSYPPNLDTSTPIAANIHSIKRNKKGIIHFKLTLFLSESSEIHTTGWRYFPESDELKPPCYRAGKGWQPTVELSGPILDKVQAEIRRIASSQQQ